jgi:hypothetical protein
MEAAVSVILGLVVSVVLGFTGVARAQEPDHGNHEVALRLFDERVQAYVALHRELEQAVPALAVTTDPSSISLARAALAAALQLARPAARQGDMFSPEIDRVFRCLVAQALEGRDIVRLLAQLSDDGWSLPRALRLDVNEPYPSGATHAVPPMLLQRLPRLPAEIEYRIVNDDLVLWDVHADLVVDFLPHALRLPAS